MLKNTETRILILQIDQVPKGHAVEEKKENSTFFAQKVQNATFLCFLKFLGVFLK